MTHAKLPAGIELLIGLDIDHSTHTATINILQPRAIKGAAIIYANRHPLKGDHMGRAFTVAQLEDAAATYSIATDPVYSELATALAKVKTPDEFNIAYLLLSAHIDRIMQRHQRNIAQLMNVNMHLAESLASSPADAAFADGFNRSSALRAAEDAAVTAQVMGRVRADPGQPPRASLNSVGRALPHNTPLYAAPVDRCEKCGWRFGSADYCGESLCDHQPDAAGASQVDPTMALPSKPSREAGQ